MKNYQKLSYHEYRIMLSDGSSIVTTSQLWLALSQLAKQVKTASANPQQTENPKYAMRTWLLRLGFIGDEFKTARELYTKRLDGDTAFRNGRPQ